MVGAPARFVRGDATRIRDFVEGSFSLLVESGRLHGLGDEARDASPGWRVVESGPEPSTTDSNKRWKEIRFYDLQRKEAAT